MHMLAAFICAGEVNAAQQELKPGMTVVTSAPVKVSQPLRSLASVRTNPAAATAAGTFRDTRLIIPRTSQGNDVKSAMDPSIVQNAPLGSSMPLPDANFEGVNNVSGVLPPDTQGDIGWDPVTGKKYYVQWVNLAYQIWDVTDPAHPAALLPNPAAGNTLWAGTGGVCQNTNDGDPLTRFDALSNRWVMSQFSVNGPYHQCIAVSQTADPTGAWYLYDFQISTSLMNDYGKLGIWSDGYYMSFNQFLNAATWAGAGVAVFERDQMLLGLPARMIYIDTGPATSPRNKYGAMLPSDLDGSAPPAGTPNYFIEWDDSTWMPPDVSDFLRVWEFKTDWINPANTTFGTNAAFDPNLKIATANVDASFAASDAIQQPGTAVKLDAIADRLMYRLQYRNFGTHQTIVGNHTVDATGTDRAGIHWFELRNTAGAGFTMHQQGVYAPDTDNRWMGSVAMDASGNMALGYSVSSGTTYPSIRYTGRLAGDAPGLLPQGEVTLIDGTGSQTSTSNRWGDYSMMAVDPVDGCTFWFTQEYMAVTSNAGWQTRIGSFRFPSCSTLPTGTLSGTVTDSLAAGISGATISITGGYSTVTDADGHYSIPLASGTYTVTASRYGYVSTVTPGVVIAAPASKTQNFSLASASSSTISGVVTDTTTGWPLYARISIPGYPGGPVFTSPVTGAYSVLLANGSYTFTVTAMSGGYTPAVNTVVVAADATQNITPAVDASTCTAPGYSLSSGCAPIAHGGLVIGAVKDANTWAVVTNATVKDAALISATMIDSSTDTAGPARMFVIGQAAGVRTLSATARSYASGSATLTVPDGGTVGGDILLPAGQLAATPGNLIFYLTVDDISSLSLSLENTGGAAAAFNIFAVPGTSAGYTPTGPFAAATRHTSPKNLNDLDSSSIRIDPTPAVLTPLAAGDVSASWITGLAYPWGIGYNTDAGDLWLGNISTGTPSGDDLDYRFTTAGVKTGDTIDTSPWLGSYGGDMTYNPFTKTLWQVNVGGDNCIYEMDPAAKTSTGNKICPAFGTSQRGLAFDPVSGTYYSGSWNDSIIHHFAPDGTILDSKNVGLRISGLAFNPSTRHLFVMTNATTTPGPPATYDLYVLDTNAAYTNLGGFNLKSGGSNVFTSAKQAGLEIDCGGNLWAVHTGTQTVYQAASGETGVCDWQSGWLSATPSTGSVAAGVTSELTVEVDTTGLSIGTYNAYLRINSDSPYNAFIVPVTLNITPTITLTYNGNGSTGGTVPSPVNYAVNATVTVLDNTGTLTKTGYTFAGWNTLADGSGTNYTAGTGTFVITSNTTLYAKWAIKSYTVSFNTNGGGTIAGQSLNYNGTATLPTEPTRLGYTFAGWYSEALLTNPFTFTTPITTDTTLYAKWSINSCTVSFNTSGGGIIASQSVNYNSTATLPTEPTRIGYTFAGWYSEALLTMPFLFTTAIIVDTTLYAKWTIMPFTPPVTPPYTPPATTDTPPYSPPDYTVTTSASPGSSIRKTDTSGGKTSYVVTVNPGYGILAVTGCNGSLSGNTYTTGVNTGDCTLSVIAVRRGTGTEPSIADALKVFQAYSGTETLTPEEMIKFDVAPVAEDGIPQGDGVVDLADVIMLLRRNVGIGGW